MNCTPQSTCPHPHIASVCCPRQCVQVLGQDAKVGIARDVGERRPRFRNDRAAPSPRPLWSAARQRTGACAASEASCGAHRSARMRSATAAICAVSRACAACAPSVAASCAVRAARASASRRAAAASASSRSTSATYDAAPARSSSTAHACARAASTSRRAPGVALLPPSAAGASAAASADGAQLTAGARVLSGALSRRALSASPGRCSGF